MASAKSAPSGTTVLLTGGSGFLGTSIIQELLDESSPLPVKELRILDLEPLKDQSDKRISYVQGDVKDPDALLNEQGKNHDRAYSITDGPPTNFFMFFDSIVEGIGYKIWPKNLWLSRWFAVSYTCTDYTFNSEKARKDFGFIPKYTSKDAFDRTIAYYRPSP